MEEAKEYFRTPVRFLDERECRFQAKTVTYRSGDNPDSDEAASQMTVCIIRIRIVAEPVPCCTYLKTTRVFQLCFHIARLSRTKSLRRSWRDVGRLMKLETGMRSCLTRWRGNSPYENNLTGSSSRSAPGSSRSLPVNKSCHRFTIRSCRPMTRRARVGCRSDVPVLLGQGAPKDESEPELSVTGSI